MIKKMAFLFTENKLIQYYPFIRPYHFCHGAVSLWERLPLLRGTISSIIQFQSKHWTKVWGGGWRCGASRLIKRVYFINKYFCSCLFSILTLTITRKPSLNPTPGKIKRGRVQKPFFLYSKQVTYRLSIFYKWIKIFLHLRFIER